MPTSTHSYDNDKHVVTLTVDIPKTEYLPLVDKKLKKYRKEVNLKGFRPGQVPMGLLRSKFGPSVMWDEINELIDKSVQEFIEAEKLKILGNPMPKKGLEISIKKPKDVQLEIEIGFVPDFELEGIGSDHVFPFLEVEVEDEKLDEEIENIRKSRSQEFQEDITDVQEGDMLSVAIREMENGEIKEDGAYNDLTFITVDTVSESLHDQLLTASVEDKIQTTLADLDTKMGEEKRVKYFFSTEDNENLPENIEEVEIEIKEVKRVKLKELNEDFYKEIFPQDEITSLDEFRERLKKDVLAQFEQPAYNMFRRDIYEHLMEVNQFSLPKEFLRLWIVETQREGKEEELKDKDLEDFMDRLRWSLIMDKLTEQHSIEVSQQDVEQRIRMAILQYFNYQIPPYHPEIEKQVQKMIEDRDTFRRYAEQIQEEKVFAAIQDEFGKDISTVSIDEFNEQYEAKMKAIETEDEVLEESLPEGQELAAEEVVETEEVAEVVNSEEESTKEE